MFSMIDAIKKIDAVNQTSLILGFTIGEGRPAVQYIIADNSPTRLKSGAENIG